MLRSEMGKTCWGILASHTGLWFMPLFYPPSAEIKRRQLHFLCLPERKIITDSAWALFCAVVFPCSDENFSYTSLPVCFVVQILCGLEAASSMALCKILDAGFTLSIVHSLCLSGSSKATAFNTSSRGFWLAKQDLH